jgi:hypothetical protein
MLNPPRMLAIALAATLLLAAAQTPAASGSPPTDQQEFCALVARLRQSAPADAKALQAARSEAETFIMQHRGVEWVGPVGRVIFSQSGKAAGEIEACPSSWVGGLSPDGALDSDTWAEPETMVFNRWRAAKPGETMTFHAALLGIYDSRSDFPAKIWVRARIVDIAPAP